MNDRDGEAGPGDGGRPGTPATGLNADPSQTSGIQRRCQQCADFNYASGLVESGALNDGPVHKAVQEKWAAGPGPDWDQWAASRPLGDPREHM